MFFGVRDDLRIEIARIYGVLAQPYTCANRAELSAWFEGFAKACSKASGVRR